MTLRYAAVEGIRAFDFGDESIVFNPLSWDAHLLNAAAAAVLDLLAGGARTAGEVEDYLRDLLVDTERAEAASHARRLLDELAQLGLVRPRAADAATADR
jgi:PqqD family protein of HPr-rel-A system